MGMMEMLIVLALAAMAAGVWLLTRHRKQAGEPVCGRCGYRVKGLPTFICPECGSDLREVGIRGGPGTSQPASRHWRLPLLLAGWTLGLVCTAFVCTWAAWQWAWPAEWRRTVTLQLSDPAGTHEVEMVGARVARVWGRTSVDLSQPGPPGLIHISWDRPRAHSMRVTIDPSNPLDESALLRLAERFDLPATEMDRARARLPALLAILNAARRTSLDKAATTAQLAVQQSGGTFPYGISWSIDSSIAEPYALWASASTASAVTWLAGIIWIVRRHRRQQDAAAALTGNAPAHGSTRTLTVMFSDMKDFTARTAGGARRHVVELVRRHRELAAPIVARRGGRIIKSIGDALLVAFDSATEAALAALEIQSAAARQDGEPDRLELRIALCTGEVVQEGTDILGDPVNLASRLQQLAEPGQVLLAEPTYVMVNRQEVPCTPAGEHAIKGMPAPVRAYLACPATPADTPIAS